MSWDRRRAVDEYPGLNDAEFRLLCKLADHENDRTGECCPKEETLALEVSKCVRQVRRLLNRLQDRGLIRIIRGNPNRYEIVIAKTISNRTSGAISTGHSGSNRTSGVDETGHSGSPNRTSVAAKPDIGGSETGHLGSSNKEESREPNEPIIEPFVLKEPSSARAPRVKSPPSHDQATGGKLTTEISHAQFIEELKRHREDIWRMQQKPGAAPFDFTPSDGNSVKLWLSKYPKVTIDRLKRCLQHRARSDVNAAEPFYKFIPKVLEFEAGPLDKYGKPQGGKDGYSPSKSEAKNDRDKDTVRRAAAAAVAEISRRENGLGPQHVSSSGAEPGDGEELLGRVV